MARLSAERLAHGMACVPAGERDRYLRMAARLRIYRRRAAANVVDVHGDGTVVVRSGARPGFHVVADTAHGAWTIALPSLADVRLFAHALRTLVRLTADPDRPRGTATLKAVRAERVVV